MKEKLFNYFCLIKNSFAHIGVCPRGIGELGTAGVSVSFRRFFPFHPIAPRYSSWIGGIYGGCNPVSSTRILLLLNFRSKEKQTRSEYNKKGD